MREKNLASSSELKQTRLNIILLFHNYDESRIPLSDRREIFPLQSQNLNLISVKGDE